MEDWRSIYRNQSWLGRMPGDVPGVAGIEVGLPSPLVSRAQGPQLAMKRKRLNVRNTAPTKE